MQPTRSTHYGGNPDLTDKEKTILKLLSHGHERADVQAVLGISTSTLTTHLHNIYQKTHTSSLYQAVGWWWQTYGD